MKRKILKVYFAVVALTLALCFIFAFTADAATHTELLANNGEPCKVCVVVGEDNVSQGCYVITVCTNDKIQTAIGYLAPVAADWFTFHGGSPRIVISPGSN